MPNIYASTNDGWVHYNDSDWATARGASTGEMTVATNTAYFAAIEASRVSARGGGYIYTVRRAFLQFDTSGVTSTVSAARLNIRGFSQGGGDVAVVQATSGATTLGNSDFDAITGWNPISDGAAGGDNRSNVTYYSDGTGSGEVDTWSTSGYNTITLNSTARTAMVDEDELLVCIINFDNDLRDIAPTGYSTHRNGMYLSNYTGTTRDPYIDYELETPADSAIFFGANF